MAQSPPPTPPEYALDRDSDVPLGTQLAWRLRSLIASGRLAEGERLPGVREMAALAGVNVNTVRTVYARLADQGVIVSEHGRGTFVGPRRRALDDLGRLAAQAAGTAREAGIDPRELAKLDVTRGGEPGDRAERRPRRPTPQLLTAAELEEIRDELVERLRPLRADRTVARDERQRVWLEEDESPRRQRAIASTTPKLETGTGGWSLRWRG